MCVFAKPILTFGKLQLILLNEFFLFLLSSCGFVRRKKINKLIASGVVAGWRLLRVNTSKFLSMLYSSYDRVEGWQGLPKSHGRMRLGNKTQLYGIVVGWR